MVKAAATARPLHGAAEPSRRRRDNTRSPVPDSPARPRALVTSCYGANLPPIPTHVPEPQDIARIANLARLELRPDESERMLAQLNGFFDIVEQMRAVDTTGVEPLAHPWPPCRKCLRLRDDVASEPNQREANQRSAPAVERGLFLVPKVIE
jgi:aspartyl-tRNA(Asn)/glutamyl-tRNA(Gln) amidotransferase subunit C